MYNTYQGCEKMIKICEICNSKFETKSFTVFDKLKVGQKITIL